MAWAQERALREQGMTLSTEALKELHTSKSVFYVFFLSNLNGEHGSTGTPFQRERER